MSTIEYRWIGKEEQAVLREIAKSEAYEWEHCEEYFAELVQFKRALVAFEEDEPVGYLLFQVIWGNTPFLSQVWLDEAYQGKGIGSLMVQKLEERLVKEGYKSLTTSNETKNQAGVGFVAKLGFQPIGTLEMSHGPEVFSVKQL